MTLTPIDIDRLEMELAGHPDRNFVVNLINGLREGFFTGINKPPMITLEHPNNMSANSHPEIVTKLIDDEVKKGFLVGHFEIPTFSTYGVAESSYSGKKHLIVDLSAPHNNNNHVS